MRQFQAVIVCCVVALAGCATPPSGPAAPGDPTTRANNEGEDEDAILLHLAIVERPLGDRVLNREVWSMADEQVLLDQKATLRANGFRVCLIGGQLPGCLQTLLQSPRFCPTLRQIHTHLNTPVPITLGPLRPHCSYQLDENGQTSTLNLNDAQCLLEVTAQAGEEGKLCLRLAPHVRHGKSTIAPHPARDPDGSLKWSWEAQQPEEVYAFLSWELTVTPDEYVVVGLPLEAAEGNNLGQLCFVSEQDQKRVQRLVVLRGARVQPALPSEEALSRSPPLAVRAAWSDSLRGSAP
jgi:hypothetical protein